MYNINIQQRQLHTDTFSIYVSNKLPLKWKSKYDLVWNNSKIVLSLPNSKIVAAALQTRMKFEAVVSSVLAISTTQQYSVSKTAHV